MPNPILDTRDVEIRRTTKTTGNLRNLRQENRTENVYSTVSSLSPFGAVEGSRTLIRESPCRVECKLRRQKTFQMLFYFKQLLATTRTKLQKGLRKNLESGICDQLLSLISLLYALDCESQQFCCFILVLPSPIMKWVGFYLHCRSNLNRLVTTTRVTTQTRYMVQIPHDRGTPSERLLANITVLDSQ